MIEFKDIVGWVVALLVAFIGVSNIIIRSKKKTKQENNNVTQSITGDNNTLAGRDLFTSEKKDKK